MPINRLWSMDSFWSEPWLKAWGLWTLAILLAVVALLVRIANFESVFGDLSGVDWWSELIWFNILVPMAGPAFATTGAFIAARRPENWVGWLSLAVGLLIAAQDIIWNYAVYTLIENPGGLPAGTLAGLLANLTGPPVTILLFSVMLLLFPTGQVASPGWRAGLWFALILLVINTIAGLFSAHVGLTLDGPAENPLAFGPVSEPAESIHVTLQFVTPLVLLAAIASTFVRHRRMQGIERQQMKWVSYVSAVIAVSLQLGIAAYILDGNSYLGMFLLAIFLGGISIGFPAAIGIAVLRYHLFDIDVVINRTLVYGSLTIILGTGYGAGVLALQFLLGQLIGGQDIAIVIATLLAVAAVRPVRDRIQGEVDRRFFRQKYDASNTLVRLGRSIREEVDLERLLRSIVHVVDETLQPDHVSIWIAESVPSRQPEVAPPSPKRF